VEKPKGKRLLGILRRRWENNINMNLRVIGWGWYGLDSGQWRALVNTVMDLRVP
jgi:hypothetical protein